MTPTPEPDDTKNQPEITPNTKIDHENKSTEPSDYSKHENHEYEPTLCAECKATELANVNSEAGNVNSMLTTTEPDIHKDSQDDVNTPPADTTEPTETFEQVQARIKRDRHKYLTPEPWMKQASAEIAQDLTESLATPPLAADARPWDTEHFNILETALRTQGVKKPLTQEFYESYDELDAYVARLTQEARIDEAERWKAQWINLQYDDKWAAWMDRRLAELNVKGDKQ